MNKRTLIFSLVFFILFAILATKIFDSRIKYANYAFTNKKLHELLLLNKDLDFFSKNKLSYNNFDDIEKVILNIEEINVYLFHKDFNNIILDEKFFILKRSMFDKIEYINNLKSIHSALNISFKYLQVIWLP